MDFLPIFMNLKGKLCLLAGGGDVARHKAGVLFAARAKVRVVAQSMYLES